MQAPVRDVRLPKKRMRQFAHDPMSSQFQRFGGDLFADGAASRSKGPPDSGGLPSDDDMFELSDDEPPQKKARVEAAHDDEEDDGLTLEPSPAKTRKGPSTGAASSSRSKATPAAAPEAPVAVPASVITLTPKEFVSAKQALVGTLKEAVDGLDGLATKAKELARDLTNLKRTDKLEELDVEDNIKLADTHIADLRAAMSGAIKCGLMQFPEKSIEVRKALDAAECFTGTFKEIVEVVKEGAQAAAKEAQKLRRQQEKGSGPAGQGPAAASGEKTSGEEMTKGRLRYIQTKLTTQLKNRGWPVSLAKAYAKMYGDDLASKENGDEVHIAENFDPSVPLVCSTLVEGKGKIAKDVCEFVKSSAGSIDAKIEKIIKHVNARGDRVGGLMLLSPPKVQSPAEVDWSWLTGAPGEVPKASFPWVVTMKEKSFRWGPRQWPLFGMPQYVYNYKGFLALYVLPESAWKKLGCDSVSHSAVAQWMEAAEHVAGVTQFFAKAEVLTLPEGHLAWIPAGYVALAVAGIRGPSAREDSNFQSFIVFPCTARATFVTLADSELSRAELKNFFSSVKDAPWSTVAADVVRVLASLS